MLEELRHLHHLAGRPSLDTVVKHAHLAGCRTSKSTLSNLLAGKPTRVDAVEAFVVGCDRYARTRHPVIQLPDEAVDQQAWRDRHAAFTAGVFRSPPAYLGKPIQQYSPTELGIHRAIDLPEHHGQALPQRDR